MNNSITANQVFSRLSEQNLQYSVLPLGDDSYVLVSARGGRIFGPFRHENDESILWINQSFSDSDLFSRFIENEDWNLGGDRVWLAPEHPFFVRNRSDFFESYLVQGELDPGHYKLIESERAVSLEQSVVLEAFESPVTEVEFRLTKHIEAVENPLRALPSLGTRGAYLGFRQEVEIQDLSGNLELPLESWFLSQVNTPGKLIVPTTVPLIFDDYYEPISSSLIDIFGKHSIIDTTGDVRYKLGFKSAVLTGRAGYLCLLPSGEYCLFIKSFFNDPSSLYCCDPYDRPGLNGCSMFLYNDSGDMGGFAEFENTGRTLLPGANKHSSHDVVHYYFYIGDLMFLGEVSSLLLGIDLEMNYAES